MLCSRCVLPVLAVYVLLEEISAAVLQSRFRNKREVGSLDQPLLQLQDDQVALSVSDTEETISRPFHSEIILNPSERTSVKHQNHNQYQYQHKGSEKRRKVAPLDSIGRFQMSTLRSRNDEPDHHYQEERD